MAQWVRGPTSSRPWPGSLLRIGLRAWPRTFHTPWPKQEEPTNQQVAFLSFTDHEVLFIPCPMAVACAQQRSFAPWRRHAFVSQHLGAAAAARHSAPTRGCKEQQSPGCLSHCFPVVSGLAQGWPLPAVLPACSPGLSLWSQGAWLGAQHLVALLPCCLGLSRRPRTAWWKWLSRAPRPPIEAWVGWGGVQTCGDATAPPRSRGQRPRSLAQSGTSLPRPAGEGLWSPPPLWALSLSAYPVLFPGRLTWEAPLQEELCCRWAASATG